MIEEETSSAPETTQHVQTDAVQTDATAETEASPINNGPVVKADNPVQRNLLHFIILLLLLPVNYFVYQSYKSSIKSGDAMPSSADGMANLLNLSKENPSYETFLSLGVAYYNTHRYQEAIDAWQSGLQYKPNSDILYSNMGAAYGCLGKWQEQKTSCEKALAINPNFALAKNNLAWALSELAKAGGTPQASNQNSTGLAVPAANTAQFNALIDQGLGYYNKKDYNTAIATWKKALEINPNSEIAYTDIGAAYGCLGMWKEQVASCEKALAINPNFQLAIGNLNWGRSELKKRGINP